MFMFVTRTSVVNGGGHGRVRDFVGLCVTLPSRLSGDTQHIRLGEGGSFQEISGNSNISVAGLTNEPIY